MKIKQIISLLFLLSFSIFLLSGCFRKTEYLPTYKYRCLEQTKLDAIPETVILIEAGEDNINTAKAYKEAVDSYMQFYEYQVDKNNKFCKEVENESIK